MKPQSQFFPPTKAVETFRRPWRSLRLRLARVLEARGALAEAEPLIRRVLDGYERQLGPEHRETLASVQNLALVLEDLGQFHEAPLLRRAAGSRSGAAFCFWEQLGKKLQGNNQHIFRSFQYCLMYMEVR